MSRRRKIRLSLITLSLLAIAAAPAAAWGPAVHAYVADHAGKWWPSLNRLEMYGATLPDACYFAYALGSNGQAACAAAAHQDYLAMWEGAPNLSTRALGFGYVSHNWEWGADRTAHDLAWGYVEIRAGLMADQLALDPRLAPLQLGDDELKAIAHTVIEAATDLQVKRIDPCIGSKMFFAALLRGSFVPQRYATVYADDFADWAAVMGAPVGDPVATLLGVEAGFRDAMLLYGIALMKPEPAAIETLAKQFAPLAANWGVNLPPDVVEPLIEELIEGAIAFTEGDFPDALRGTTSYVRWNMYWNGVWY